MKTKSKNKKIKKFNKYRINKLKTSKLLLIRKK